VREFLTHLTTPQARLVCGAHGARRIRRFN
jgi:hypothetical protein